MRRVVDFARPIAVLLVAVLHFIRDEEDPAGIVGRLRDAMAPGSFLVVSHATGDFHPQIAAKVAEVYQRASAPLVLRDRAQVARLFDGFDLVAPGLVEPASWHPDPEGLTKPSAGGFFSGVGRCTSPLLVDQGR